MCVRVCVSVYALNMKAISPWLTFSVRYIWAKNICGQMELDWPDEFYAATFSLLTHKWILFSLETQYVSWWKVSQRFLLLILSFFVILKSEFNFETFFYVFLSSLTESNLFESIKNTPKKLNNLFSKRWKLIFFSTKLCFLAFAKKIQMITVCAQYGPV